MARRRVMCSECCKIFTTRSKDRRVCYKCKPFNPDIHKIREQIAESHKAKKVNVVPNGVIIPVAVLKAV